MNSLAEFILYLYLIVFLSMLFFDIACIFLRKLNNQIMEKLKAEMATWLNREKGSHISLKSQKKLIKKLKNINYFISFTNVMDNTKEQTEFLKSLKYTFLKILPHYQKEEIIRQTYFVHFLAENAYIYKESRNPIINYLISCSVKNSVYLRENALNALYAVGEVEYIKEAFYQMNYKNIRHHHKLITDGLLKFKGNKEKLAQMLIKDMRDYKEDYKIACINYFSYKKIDCKEQVYQLLSNKQELKEVRIACIRYFSNVTYDKVVPFLYELLKADKYDWEYAAVAASTLGKYQNKETTKWLIHSLSSHNWYVRNNAAQSLTKTTPYDLLLMILKKTEDKYAFDALTYQMRLQRKEG